MCSRPAGVAGRWYGLDQDAALLLWSITFDPCATLLHGSSRLASGAGRRRKVAPSLTLRPLPCRSKPKQLVATAQVDSARPPADPCNTVSGYNWCALVETDISRWK